MHIKLKRMVHAAAMAGQYSSAAINIDVNGRVCGALVQFDGYPMNTDISECVKAPSILIG